MDSALIKVGMLIAYDYQYAYHSIPLIYDHADQITLAVDEHQRSWAGLPHTTEDSLVLRYFQWLMLDETVMRMTGASV